MRVVWGIEVDAVDGLIEYKAGDQRTLYVSWNLCRYANKV
jgi:hypothetical protein